MPPDTITIADIEEWLAVTITGTDSEASTQRAIDATLDYASWKWPAPTDSEGVELNPWPHDYKTGLIIKVCSLRRRPDTPVGTVNFDGYTERIAAYDPDVARLLAPYETVAFG